MSSKQFVVAIEVDLLTAVNRVATTERERERAWIAKTREEAGVAGLRGVELSAARAEIRQRLAELRADGALAGSRDLVVGRALQAELTHRGMNRDWTEPPAATVDAPGRRWGASPWRYTDELDARLAVRLPATLGVTVVRAAYWTSAPAVAALQEWRRTWGDGPEVRLRDLARAHNGLLPAIGVIAAAMGPRVTRAAIEERIRLQAQILTTGDLVRAAARRATGHRNPAA